MSAYRKKRYSSSSGSTKGRLSKLIASAMATRGQWTYAGFSARIAAAVGEQAWLPFGANPWITSRSDLVAVITDAITRTTVIPNRVSSSDPSQQPIEFYIKRAKMKLTITNTSQIDCDIICYPWRMRYDGVDPPDLYTAATVNITEDKAGSTSTQQGLLTNTTTTIGYTPFMSRTITQAAKLGKPRRVHLQGGQSYTFTIEDTKPLHVTYPRWNTTSSFAPHTRGMFMTFRGIPVNDQTNTDEIDFGFCALDVQNVTTYEWEAPIAPWKYNDVIVSSADVQDIKIIQPQTGAVTTGPVSV